MPYISIFLAGFVGRSCSVRQRQRDRERERARERESSRLPRGLPRGLLPGRMLAPVRSHFFWLKLPRLAAGLEAGASAPAPTRWAPAW
eukprot:3443632-Pyramimonas_sp.AAC.1